MKLAIKTCTLDLPYLEMLDFCVDQDVGLIELGTGNWSSAPHLDLDQLLSSEATLNQWLSEQEKRNIKVCALNCSGNPLAYEEDLVVTYKTFQLAEKIGVKKIVMMSGLPPGHKNDRTPAWITTSWPPETQDILEYQWTEVAIPVWGEIIKKAKNHGIEKIALENHGMQLVYNPETLFKLRSEIGPMVGMNLDPSHLFWMGSNPIDAVRILGEQNAIYFVHGKDARIEVRNNAPNGVLDTKPIERFKERSWNYVAVGAGHDQQWWHEFVSVLRMYGYDDIISLEMEDLTMSSYSGHLISLETLRKAIR